MSGLPETYSTGMNPFVVTQAPTTSPYIVVERGKGILQVGRGGGEHQGRLEGVTWYMSREILSPVVINGNNTPKNGGGRGEC